MEYLPGGDFYRRPAAALATRDTESAQRAEDEKRYLYEKKEQ